jgi:predicted DCC family thiol-disulfide oxidoreductase YuxK
MFSRVQVAFLYLQASVLKSKVEEWANGTAMYYWLLHPSFGVPNWLRVVARVVVTVPVGVALLTWGVVALEFFLAIGLFLPSRARRYLLFAGLGLHTGIALLMGLTSFSLTMAAALLLLLHPADQPIVLIHARVRDETSSRGEGRTAVVVFIDGFCSLCRKIGRTIQALDKKARVELVSFRHSECYRLHGIALDALERRMHVVDTRSGEVRQGFGAIRVLVRELHVLWPLRPMFAMLDRVGMGDRLYDALAVRRRIIPTPNNCEGSCKPTAHLGDV